MASSSSRKRARSSAVSQAEEDDHEPAHKVCIGLPAKVTFTGKSTRCNPRNGPLVIHTQLCYVDLPNTPHPSQLLVLDYPKSNKGKSTTSVYYEEAGATVGFDGELQPRLAGEERKNKPTKTLPLAQFFRVVRVETDDEPFRQRLQGPFEHQALGYMYPSFNSLKSLIGAAEVHVEDPREPGSCYPWNQVSFYNSKRYEHTQRNMFLCQAYMTPHMRDKCKRFHFLAYVNEQPWHCLVRCPLQVTAQGDIVAVEDEPVIQGQAPFQADPRLDTASSFLDEKDTIELEGSVAEHTNKSLRAQVQMTRMVQTRAQTQRFVTHQAEKPLLPESQRQVDTAFNVSEDTQGTLNQIFSSLESPLASEPTRGEPQQQQQQQQQQAQAQQQTNDDHRSGDELSLEQHEQQISSVISKHAQLVF